MICTELPGNGRRSRVSRDSHASGRGRRRSTHTLRGLLGCAKGVSSSSGSRVAHGADAVQVGAAPQPELAVLDLNIPRFSGGGGSDARKVMLHHLVPSEVAPGSLGSNLDFYEPRTAHGSSLSPPIHAALFPRAGRPDEALAPLQLAARLDLDDVTATTAGGVHLATMGGLWQALAMGFAGVRPDGEVLAVDPCLPDAWNGLELRLRFRGVPLRLRTEHELVMVDADAPVAIRVGDAPVVSGGRLRWTRANDSWKVCS